MVIVVVQDNDLAAVVLKDAFNCRANGLHDSIINCWFSILGNKDEVVLQIKTTVSICLIEIIAFHRIFPFTTK